MKRFLSFSLLVCFALSVHAANWWTNAEYNDWSWGNANNWGQSTVPDFSSAAVEINKSGWETRAQVSPEGDFECGSLLVGKNWGPSYLVVKGSLKAYDNVTAGNWGSDADGTIEVSQGGSFIAEKALFLGRSADTRGVLNVNSGTVEVNWSLYVPGDWSSSGGTAELNAYGGTVTADDIVIQDGGTVDVTGGTLQISGYKKSKFEQYIEDGLLTAYGGDPRGSISIVENGTYTVITASMLPEENVFNPLPADTKLLSSYTSPLTLYWQPGEFETHHDVYFGTDYEDVFAATPSSMDIYQGRFETPDSDPNLVYSYGPMSGLSLDEEYFWRVDSVNTDTSEVWKGDVWSFSTPESNLIDDFESYDEGSPVGDVWTGSPDPNSVIAENQQSIELKYNNGIAETSRVLPFSSLSFGEGEVITVSFFGELPMNAQLSTTLTDSSSNSATVHYSPSLADRANQWKGFDAKLSDFANEGVDITDVQTVTLGIDATGCGEGSIFLDDLQVYPKRCVGRYALGDFRGTDCIADLGDYSVIANDWGMTGQIVTASESEPAGLTARYKFNETEGEIVSDSSANQLDGEFKGTSMPAGAWNPESGREGGCLDLSAISSGWFQFPGEALVPERLSDPNAAGTDEVTVSLWVNGNTGARTSANNLMKFRNPSWAGGVFLPGPYQKEGNIVEFALNSDKLNWGWAGPEDWQGSWNHYAFVKNADLGEMFIYRNGEMMARQAYFPLTPIDVTNWELIPGWSGRIDDLRFYNRALSHEEILYLAKVSSVYQSVRSWADKNHDNSVDLTDLSNMFGCWIEEKLWPFED
ncbi:hypothetical protein L21SP3_01987 [Sedimentisphaera cyanobacteriorum]|uniref:LamG-like jellyroll fold domain-containing protein n=1 Tax=Sedimentisphaera cyanobacteriorum TaxID=1940790 RepID=A0A1Q2HRS3_9BACT|nr:LamG domain-containing protein [Sedimentisphaera cyanobacteriorum]AQQ10159.1 hypothetical protein L21SP3_01987 [Sedimentisphaera cyanobacteriorum]